MTGMKDQTSGNVQHRRRPWRRALMAVGLLGAASWWAFSGDTTEVCLPTGGVERLDPSSTGNESYAMALQTAWTRLRADPVLDQMAGDVTANGYTLCMVPDLEFAGHVQADDKVISLNGGFASADGLLARTLAEEIVHAWHNVTGANGADRAGMIGATDMLRYTMASELAAKLVSGWRFHHLTRTTDPALAERPFLEWLRYGIFADEDLMASLEQRLNAAGGVEAAELEAIAATLGDGLRDRKLWESYAEWKLGRLADLLLEQKPSDIMVLRDRLEPLDRNLLEALFVLPDDDRRLSEKAASWREAWADGPFDHLGLDSLSLLIVLNELFPSRDPLEHAAEEAARAARQAEALAKQREILEEARQALRDYEREAEEIRALLEGETSQAGKPENGAAPFATPAPAHGAQGHIAPGYGATGHTGSAPQPRMP